MERNLSVLDSLGGGSVSYRECPFNQLFSIFQTITENLSDFDLILDALDECTDSENLEVILKELIQISARPSVRVILLSRHSESFALKLNQAVHLRITADLVSSDIRQFSEQRIASREKFRGIEKEVLSKISEKAGEMFLWVVMMLEYVDSASTRNGQLENLSKFPPKLMDSYETFMDFNARNLTPDQLEVRKEIFMLIVGAVRPLTVDEISAALASRDFKPIIDDNDFLLDPAEEISRVCWPLITISENLVQLIHASAKDFLLSSSDAVIRQSVRFSRAECNRFILKKCLTVLNQDVASWELSYSFFIQHNFKLLQDGLGNADSPPKLSNFYRYACLCWHSYLGPDTQDKEYVDAVKHFLAGSQFVTWAESVLFFQEWQDVGLLLMARASIMAWYQSNVAFRDSNWLACFFIQPYSLILESYRKDEDRPLMQYLVLHRLGTYHNMSVDDFNAMYDTRKETAYGFKRLLGDQHPLTLQAMTEFCIERLARLELREAENELEEMIEKQRKRPDADPYTLYYAQSYLGVVQLHRTKFEQSAKTQEEASQGLLGLLGKANREYSKARLFLAWALEAQGSLTNGFAILQQVWDIWTPLHSADSPLSMMVQISMAVIFKKLGNFHEAEEHMLKVLVNRKRIFGVDNPITFDTAMNLAFLYREMTQTDKAKEVLDSVGVYVDQLDFERYCQYHHAQALLFLDDGQHTKCAELLSEFLQRARKENRNISREQLWMRLALAQTAPVAGFDLDMDALFGGLTSPCSTDPKNVMCGGVIEHALSLAKENKIVESIKLLESQGLKWAEEEYFWIHSGGPFAAAF